MCQSPARGRKLASVILNHRQARHILLRLGLRTVAPKSLALDDADWTTCPKAFLKLAKFMPIYVYRLNPTEIDHGALAMGHYTWVSLCACRAVLDSRVRRKSSSPVYACTAHS